MDIRQFITPEDRILLIAPHADDEVLGAGGLLSVAKEIGAKVYVLYVTLSGYTPTRGGSASDVDSRGKELESAVNALGLDGYDVLYKGEKYHLKLDSIPILEIVRWLELESNVSVSKVKPTILLIPSGKHNHQDHRVVYDAGLSIVRTNHSYEDGKYCCMTYEIPGVGQAGLPTFDPSFYLEMDESMIDRKCKLFSLYSSQVAVKPHLRSLHSIKSLAQYRGIEAGYEYAEAFELLRMKYRMCR